MPLPFQPKPLDADAAAFIARSGATDRNAINAFVRGVKALGLWNNMVCWPLRSSQNAGTGTTAFSLGGLGTFNGTLVNGPVWTADGLQFDGSDDEVTLPNGSFGVGNNPIGVWSFSKNDQNTTRQVVVFAGDGNVASNVMGVEAPSFSNADTTGVTFAGLSFSLDLNWKSFVVGHSAIEGFGGKNGGSASAFAFSTPLNKDGTGCRIGRMSTPVIAPFDGLIAAVIRLNVTPTTTLNGQIHNLYKSTLGTGLGLP